MVSGYKQKEKMLMRNRVWLSVFVLVVLVSATPMWAQGFRRIATIEVPGEPLVSFDISWVDEPGTTYYLADRSNAGIDIFDAHTNRFVDRVGGFVGLDPRGTPYSGPNGIVVIDDRGELWAGDGDSTVKVIDLHSRQIIDEIDTGGAKRADEIAYDPQDEIILVTNNEESPPYASFIAAETHEILGTLEFPEATDGLEQPVWDKDNERFLLAIPQTRANPGGEIDVIDPKSMEVIDVFPLSPGCSPHGLDIGPDQQAIVGCSLMANARTIIMDTRDGTIVATITQVGGSDQVWFNPGDGNYYLGARSNPGGPVLGIIDAKTNMWLQNVPTTPAAHSVAASSLNNHVFVPLTPVASDRACPRGCIGVYAGSDDDD
jgi:DNA-binding beta-propeller fold protein YncE